MGDATDMEHDTEEGPGGGATHRRSAWKGCHRHQRRAGGDTTDTEGVGVKPHKVIKGDIPSTLDLSIRPKASPASA